MLLHSAGLNKKQVMTVTMTVCFQKVSETPVSHHQGFLVLPVMVKDEEGVSVTLIEEMSHLQEFS